jgi:hypothetical protein
MNETTKASPPANGVPVKSPALAAAAPDLPGMPAGKVAVDSVAAKIPPDKNSGLDRGANPVSPAPAKPLFGGNVGRKTRADGLTPGSPEALAAVRARDAKRKREERAAKTAVAPPPPLPGAPAPAVEMAPGAAEVPLLAVGGEMGDQIYVWTAEDFRQCAPELVELAEAWRIDSHTKRAVKGKLPRVVVEEIKKDAAFPAGSKKSLSNSSPVTLSKMFNALKVPVAFKSIISAAPALAYIIVRDLQTGSRIEKLIAENKAIAEKAGEEKKT